MKAVPKASSHRVTGRRFSYFSRDNVREKIQNNLSKKVVHIKIKADETGINPVLSKTGNEIIKTTKPNSGVGKRTPLAVTPTNKDRIKRPDLKQQEIE